MKVVGGESFVRGEDVEGFKRARLGGGHPATSSSELDEASIAWRGTKNDSYGKVQKRKRGDGVTKREK